MRGTGTRRVPDNEFSTVGHEPRRSTLPMFPNVLAIGWKTWSIWVAWKVVRKNVTLCKECKYLLDRK